MSLSLPLDMSSLLVGEPYVGAARSKIALLYQLWMRSMLLVASPLK